MLEAGNTIANKYLLEQQIGKGGMGVVWLARHVALGDKPVAIKFLLNAVSKNQHERFRLEALLASRIQSRHVVQVLDFGEHEGAPYLVMEHLEGHDLRHLLDQRRTVDPDLVVTIIAQAARGLQKAHEAGMIHRDIKPENLFLCHDEDGRLLVKILDFGIAKSFETDSGTATGMMLGTAYYMSPEQFQARKGVDPQIDLWSLACVAYEMLVGVRVFDGESIIVIGMDVLAEKRPVPSQFAPGLPQGFDAWFAKALSPNPANRFGSALELAESLAAALEVNCPVLSLSLDPDAVHRQMSGEGFRTTGGASSAFTPSVKSAVSRTRGIVGAVGFAVAIGVAGIFALRSSARVARPQSAAQVPKAQSAGSSVVTVPHTKPEAEVPSLARAAAMVREGNIAAAHALLNDLPADSPLRADARFLDIENTWADLQFSKIDLERDNYEKLRMLSELVASGADDPRRMRARSLLQSTVAARSSGSAGGKSAKSASSTKATAVELAKPDPPPSGVLPPRF